MAIIRQSNETESIEGVLAWLAAPPTQDPLADLMPLRRSLRTLAGADIQDPHKLRIMRIVEPRLARVDAEVQSLLLDTALPLSRPLHDIARAILECHARTADILDTANATVPAESKTRGIFHLGRQILLSVLAFGHPPRGFWSSMAERLPAIQQDAASLRLAGRVFALAAAQPDSLAPRELLFLDAVLQQSGAHIELESALPESMPSTLFWLDPEQDLAPWPAARGVPIPGTSCLAADFSSLIERVRGTVELLESGTPGSQLGLPREANLPDYRNVLQRTLSFWVNPPLRRLPRRSQRQEIRMCIRLGDLWRVLQDETLSDGEISDWVVTNKSPNGYAVTHVGGKVSGLIAGAALGIREMPDAPWSVCLIRWARSDGPEQVDLGLEIIAPHAHAVRLVPDASDHEAVPALLLPALPRVLRREALLTARGRYGRHSFNLVGGKADQITLTSCRPGHLILETSSVEIFEFERLREPG